MDNSSHLSPERCSCTGRGAGGQALKLEPNFWSQDKDWASETAHKNQGNRWRCRDEERISEASIRRWHWSKLRSKKETGYSHQMLPLSSQKAALVSPLLLLSLVRYQGTGAQSCLSTRLMAGAGQSSSPDPVALARRYQSSKKKKNNPTKKSKEAIA